jgi:hypothetical protein
LSAKPRRLKDLKRNFAVAPPAGPPMSGGQVQALFDRVRADPTVLMYLDPGIRLAIVRAYVMWEQFENRPDGMPLLTGPKAEAVNTGGRPRSVTPAQMLAAYEFASEHLEALRGLGFGNVPSNKSELRALLEHYFPDDPKRSIATLKKTLQRERARRRR